MSLFERLCECLKKKKKDSDECSLRDGVAPSEGGDDLGMLPHDQHAQPAALVEDHPPPPRRRKPTPYPSMLSGAVRRRPRK
jgi:hypothetical protein